MKTSSQIQESANKLNFKVSNNKKAFNELHNHVQDNEEILALFDTSLHLVALTNNKLIIIKAGMLMSTDVTDINLDNIQQIKIDGKLVYATSRYPEVPLSSNDIYVYTTQGDRFDILAQQYYKNSSLWWVISIANTGNAGAGTLVSLPQNSLIIPEGIQIRIPSNYANVIRNFNAINV